MKSPVRLATVGLLFGVLIVSEIPLGADPGFGLLKKRKVTLQVRRPAPVRLANTSIAFITKEANANYRAVSAPLEATLETELVSNERTLVKKGPADADWTILLTVTGFSIPQPTTRTQPVKNNTALTFVRWTGSLKAAYQVVDRRGRVHAADNVQASYDKEFQANAPAGGFKLPAAIPFVGGSKDESVPTSTDDVMQTLVKSVVQQISTSLGNTVQPIEAQVAGGDDRLDRAGDFMEQRLWARAIEELEKTPAFPKPEHESYRLYSLGLAYEGMSYEGKTYAEQRASLFKAQEYYDQATEMNREQRYFVQVVARLKDSLARYRTLDAMQRDDQKRAATAAVTDQPPAQPATPVATSATRPATPSATSAARPTAPRASPAAPKGPSSASQAPAAAAPGGKALTVNDVIEMHAAGVARQQIVEVIRSSSVQFNFLDKNTLLAIARAKLPIDLQNEMRKKVGLAPLAVNAQ
jgi:hypothetical protein